MSESCINEADRAGVSSPFHFDLLDSRLSGLPCLQECERRAGEREAREAEAIRSL